LDIRVPARRINEIVLGKRGVTPDTALRLAKYIQMSPQFWLGLQMDYELDVAEDEIAEKINREVQEFEATMAP
jgi:addiction module HigA family antidote